MHAASVFVLELLLMLMSLVKSWLRPPTSLQVVEVHMGQLCRGCSSQCCSLSLVLCKLNWSRLSVVGWKSGYFIFLLVLTHSFPTFTLSKFPFHVRWCFSFWLRFGMVPGFSIYLHPFHFHISPLLGSSSILGGFTLRVGPTIWLAMWVFPCNC